MSNYASLELCKELYELSGWADTYFSYNNTGGEYKPECTVRQLQGLYIAPAYDLGYLLRKLPEETTIFSMNKVWTCGLVTSDGADKATGDSPEDAAAKLAIGLIQQGEIHGG